MGYSEEYEKFLVQRSTKSVKVNNRIRGRVKLARTLRIYVYEGVKTIDKSMLVDFNINPLLFEKTDDDFVVIDDNFIKELEKNNIKYEYVNLSKKKEDKQIVKIYEKDNKLYLNSSDAYLLGLNNLEKSEEDSSYVLLDMDTLNYLESNYILERELIESKKL